MIPRLRGSRFSLRSLRLKSFLCTLCELSQRALRFKIFPTRSSALVTQAYLRFVVSETPHMSETPRTHIESQDVPRTAPPPRCCSRTTLSDPTHPQNNANHPLLCAHSQILHEFLNLTISNRASTLTAAFLKLFIRRIDPCGSSDSSRKEGTRGGRNTAPLIKSHRFVTGAHFHEKLRPLSYGSRHHFHGRLMARQ